MKNHEKAVLEVRKYNAVLQEAVEAALQEGATVPDISSTMRRAFQSLALLRRHVGRQSLDLYPESSGLAGILEKIENMEIGDTHQVERARMLVYTLVMKAMTIQEIDAIAYGKHILPHTAHHADTKRDRKEPAKNVERKRERQTA
ncbi:MAG: hypothetical protein ABL890_04840 [Candidatus Peribacteraceae bacterium]